MKTAFILFSALAVSAFASAQDIPFNSLRIGDNAPAFKPTSAAKGEYITSFQKGKTYVLEFWATWCGPCIYAMSDLSDLADKYKGRAEFYSVNTMDYVENGKYESLAEHTKKINDWVAKNSDKMRYNSVLDDIGDPIYKSWAVAIGRDAVPVCFIVNDEGKIAWFGHPLKVDKTLTAVLDKTWNIKAFRDVWEKDNEPRREADFARPKIIEFLRAKEIDKVEACIDNAKHKASILYAALYSAFEIDPNITAIRILKKYDGDILSVADWYPMVWDFLPRVTNPNSKSDILKISENKVNRAKASDAAKVYACHANLLITAGDKVGAKPWLDKASKALDQYEPVGDRAYYKKLIDDIAKKL